MTDRSKRSPRPAFRRGTAAQSAERFLASYARKLTRRPPESPELLTRYTPSGKKRREHGKFRIVVTNETYWKIQKEAVRRGIEDRDVVDLAVRDMLPTATNVTPDASAPAARIAPNRRGEGPSYRAAESCRAGTPVEQAAAREGVSVASVIRAIRFNGSRVG